MFDLRASEREKKKEAKGGFQRSKFTFKTFFGSHIYNTDMHSGRVFLCGRQQEVQVWTIIL